jgi:hypothetical protein
VVSETEQKNIAILAWMAQKETKGSTALSPEIINQTAIGLPPVTFAAYLITIFVKRRHFGGTSATPSCTVVGMNPNAPN